MKYLALSLCFILVFGLGCSSDDADPNIPSMMTDDKDPDDQNDGELGEVLYQGDFMDDAHPTSGIASVDQTGSALSFTNFKTDNGPVLEVYLATDRKVDDFVSLGELKGIEGDFTYDIPSNVDLETHNYVLIWCVEFSVNFGYAILE
ncbi:DM13 domain-containing protein [Echinicola salinicaeni]|uniref:DM13 domain-containing protein n=1 Tax=Echinicola salinicaeni TaxID=2762757 RepID=UPI0016487BA7|nr:DM13 domain-containing protein [Echinicola salinicaeni]